jgi:transcriptional regulator with XRE-family HTH domain
VINGKQIRAARALLDWTIDDLSDRSGCSRPTLFRLESGKDVLFSKAQAVHQALQDAGIEFLEGPEGIGVRLKKQARLL